MARAHQDLFSPLNQLRSELDRLFTDVAQTFGERAQAGGTRSGPAVNVWQHEHECFVEAELPGLRHEDLDISVVGNELTIKGQRQDAIHDGVNWHRRERYSAPFTRVVKLPTEIAADQVEATLRDGVLLIKVPQAEAARPRKIAVSAG